MYIRQKTKVLDELSQQFKEFNIPLDIEYKSYASMVGPRKALSVIGVKRSFKQWKYLLIALGKHCPELKAPKATPVKEVPKPKEAPKPEVKSSRSGLSALKASKAVKEADDGKDI